MELLEPFWQLPVVLDAVAAETRGEAPQLVLAEDTTYYLRHHTPPLWRLFPGKPALVLFLVIAFLVVIVSVNFLAIRLLGIKVPRSYRAGHFRLNNASWREFTSGEWEGAIEGSGYKRLQSQLLEVTSHHAILIRADREGLSNMLTALDGHLFEHQSSSGTVDALALSDNPLLRHQLASASTGPGRPVVFIDNFESIAFNADRRLIVLEMLEELIDSGASVTLVCDVAPLYMLTHQSRYIPNSMQGECADAQEIVRWSRLLSEFTKYYGWSPPDLEFTEIDARDRALLKEVSAWPELYRFKDEVDALDSQQAQRLSQEQVIQYISTHAGPIYRRRWSLCTKEEKLLLYQLARNQLINPENIEPLEHLMRRGFVRRDPQWSIVNESFARFVLTAEEERTYLKWMKASEQGLWKVLRVPLFTAALVILGILMYSAQEAIESFLALATGVLALLPLLLRNLSLVRGSPSPPAESGG